LLLDPLDRSITFTVRQPPKVLRKVPEDPIAVMMGVWDDGPEWELALDPTAAAAADEEEEYEEEEAPSGFGVGLAGAHGVLGRCSWYRVRLASAAMEGGQAQRCMIDNSN
jgi:hypothetical protein